MLVAPNFCVRSVNWFSLPILAYTYVPGSLPPTQNTQRACPRLCQYHLCSFYSRLHKCYITISRNFQLETSAHMFTVGDTMSLRLWRINTRKILSCFIASATLILHNLLNVHWKKNYNIKNKNMYFFKEYASDIYSDGSFYFKKRTHEKLKRNSSGQRNWLKELIWKNMKKGVSQFKVSSLTESCSSSTQYQLLESAGFQRAHK